MLKVPPTVNSASGAQLDPLTGLHLPQSCQRAPVVDHFRLRLPALGCHSSVRPAQSPLGGVSIEAAWLGISSAHGRAHVTDRRGRGRCVLYVWGRGASDTSGGCSLPVTADSTGGLL